MTSPAEVVAPPTEESTGEWKFDVTGYFRAPLRFSWGPQTTTDPANGSTTDAGTQLRTPPLVPDANYIDWRYTNSMVAPWTELNFHYGNDRVKATVQIASYNITDSGYRRLEANLGINEAFISMSYPEFIDEDARLTMVAGAYTNRYGAAGRYDAGRYETYLFGRTHVAGATVTFDQDVNDWTFEAEGGFGGKLEPIPFYASPGYAPDEPQRQPARLGALPRSRPAGVDVRRARAPGRRLPQAVDPGRPLDRRFRQRRRARRFLHEHGDRLGRRIAGQDAARRDGSQAQHHDLGLRPQVAGRRAR